MITALAFFYVPLSFVTGIFGMNVKEINGSPLSLWVCFAALGVVIAATSVGFLLYWVGKRAYQVREATRDKKQEQMVIHAVSWAIHKIFVLLRIGNSVQTTTSLV